MGTAVTTDFSATAKLFVEPVVKKACYAASAYLKRLEKKDVFQSKRWNHYDNYYRIPTRVTIHANARGAAENSHVSNPDTGSRVQMSAKLKKITADSQLTYEIKKLSRLGGETRAAMAEDILEGMKSDMTDGMKNAFVKSMIGHPDSYHADSTYGDMGVRAVCDGASSGTTVTLEYHKGSTIHSQRLGSRWLMPGMKCRVGTAAEILAGTADNVTVSSVADDHKTCVVSSSFTWADGDLWVVGDSDGYENALVTGLFKHLNNDSGTYQGLSRSTYPAIKGNVSEHATPGTLRAMSETIYDRAAALPLEYGAESKVNLIMCVPAMGRVWKNLFTSLRQYDPTKPIIGGGVDIKIDSFVPVEDYLMLNGTFFGIDTTQMQLIYADEFMFEESNGSIFFGLDDNDTQRVRMRWLGNQICVNPRGTWQIRDLKEDDQS